MILVYDGLAVPVTTAEVLRVLERTMSYPEAERFAVIQVSDAIKAYITAKVGFYSGVQSFTVHISRFQGNGTIPGFDYMPGYTKTFDIRYTRAMPEMVYDQYMRLALNAALDYIKELAEKIKE